MNLTQCPYDGTEIEVDASSGGSMLLACPACCARWEWHGAWMRRIKAPSRAAVIEARAQAQAPKAAASAAGSR